MLTTKHGTQPVSVRLEKCIEIETYESLKTFLQAGGCGSYLRNVVANAKKITNRHCII